jgi:glutaredoxin-related protein
MAHRTWRFLTNDDDLHAWEANASTLSCAVEIALEDGSTKRLSVVTASWLRRQLEDIDRWATFGPQLVIADDVGGGLRAEVERAMDGGHVHAFHRTR